MLKKIMLALTFIFGGQMLFAESGLTVDENAFAIDNFFLFICAVLVLFMQAGFSMLEAGLNASKNTVNILMKNVMDLGLGVLLYYVIGYGIMYPGDYNGYFGFGGFGYYRVFY